MSEPFQWTLVTGKKSNFTPQLWKSLNFNDTKEGQCLFWHQKNKKNKNRQKTRKQIQKKSHKMLTGWTSILEMSESLEWQRVNSPGSSDLNLGAAVTARDGVKEKDRSEDRGEAEWHGNRRDYREGVCGPGLPPGLGRYQRWVRPGLLLTNTHIHIHTYTRVLYHKCWLLFFLAGGRTPGFYSHCLPNVICDSGLRLSGRVSEWWEEIKSSGFKKVFLYFKWECTYKQIGGKVIVEQSCAVGRRVSECVCVCVG